MRARGERKISGERHFEINPSPPPMRGSAWPIRRRTGSLIRPLRVLGARGGGWLVQDCECRPGTYTLHAFTDGEMGEYSMSSVAVTAGTTNALGDRTWNVPRAGTFLAWESACRIAPRANIATDRAITTRASSGHVCQ